MLLRRSTEVTRDGAVLGAKRQQGRIFDPPLPAFQLIA